MKRLKDFESNKVELKNIYGGRTIKTWIKDKNGENTGIDMYNYESNKLYNVLGQEIENWHWVN